MSLAQALAALSKLFLKTSCLVGLKNAAVSTAVIMGAGEMQTCRFQVVQARQFPTVALLGC